MLLQREIQDQLNAGDPPEAIGRKFAARINGTQDTSSKQYLIHFACREGLTDLLKVILPVSSPELIREPLQIHHEKRTVIDDRGRQNVIEDEFTEKRIPLMLACYSGNLEAIRLLSQYHPDPNIPDNHGDTPIIYAARHARLDMVELLFDLFDNKIDLDIQQGQKYTATHFCAYGTDETFETRYKIAEVLLAKGAKLGFQNTNGYSEIGSCVFGNAENNIRFAQLFLKHGAEPDSTKNCHGRTPRQDAERYFPELAQLFQNPSMALDDVLKSLQARRREARERAEALIRKIEQEKQAAAQEEQAQEEQAQKKQAQKKPFSSKPVRTIAHRTTVEDLRKALGAKNLFQMAARLIKEPGGKKIVLNAFNVLRTVAPTSSG